MQALGRRFILVTVALIPWVLLAGLGGYWLWQHDYLSPFIWLVTPLYCLLFIINRWLVDKQNSASPAPPVFQPDRLHTPASEKAWVKVEQIADTINTAEYPLGDAAKLIQLARHIIAEVAKAFKPNASSAELDVPLTDLMLIMERVCHDMHEILIEQVPASHLITIQDGLVVWQWKENLRKLGLVGDLGRMLTSPISLFVTGSKGAFINGFARYSLAEVEKWLLQNLVRKLGYYAVMVCSGELSGVTADNKRVKGEATYTEKPQIEYGYRPDEPLLILVAGQTKSGKSSLINALLGELRTPTDVLPSSGTLVPYRLERQESFLGMVYDSPGYGDNLSWVERHGDELQTMDFILLTCSAVHAGRAADLRFLQAIRSHYEKTADLIPPPVIVVVTHVDLLRPTREWNPPYDFDKPSGTKEIQIRACMGQIARTLLIPIEQVRPVCLRSGDEWNIEAVWSAIAAQLSQARQAHYLRDLKAGRSKGNWELLLRQVGNAGHRIVGGFRKARTGK